MLQIPIAPAVKFRKPPAAPKLTGLTIHPATNGGAVVTHHFQAHAPKQFVFRDPATMTSHLNKALRSERWHPQANLATKVLHDINL